MKVAGVLAATAGVTALVAIAPAAYADGTTSTSGSTTTCGALPSWAEGRPANVHVRAAAADYLWHDANGWHLRVTHHTTHRMVFAGRITSSDTISYVRARDEKRDRTVRSADGKALSFRFTNYGGIDGVDFTDACAATTTFAFTVDGHWTPLSRIVVGAQSTHPASNPFTISRQDSAAAA